MGYNTLPLFCALYFLVASIAVAPIYKNNFN